MAALAALALTTSAAAQPAAAPKPVPRPLVPLVTSPKPAIAEFREQYGRCRSSFDLMANTKSTVTWTGACVDGFADGPGRRITVTDSTFTSDRLHTLQTTMAADGVMTHGYAAGLWCPADSNTKMDGVDQRPAPLQKVCSVAAWDRGRALPWALVRQPDGSWQFDSPYQMLGFSGVRASDGAIRALSQKLIDDAHAGRTDQAIELPVTASFMADLVPGGALSLVDAPTDPADISGKTVALILSTHALKELERWDSARAEFERTKGYGAKFMTGGFLGGASSGGSGGLFGPVTDAGPGEVLAATDSKRFAPSMASAVRPLAGKLITGDDLSVLSRGDADYALVLDWSFTGGLTPPAAQALIPKCVAQPCANLFSQSVTAVLVDRKIRARVVTVYTETKPRYSDDYADTLRLLFNNFWAADGDSPAQSVLTQGLAGAMSPENLNAAAVRYADGRNAKKNENAAMALYNVAAQKGSPWAMYNLAQFYLRQDPQAEAQKLILKYLEWASQAGLSEASTSLTVIYDAGKAGQAVDKAKAARYAKLAYSQQHTGAAAFNMGVVSEGAYGDPEDIAAAARYYREAQSLGYEPATAALVRVGPKADQLEAAAKAADDQAAGDAAFAKTVAATKTAAALFALGDEMADKGDVAKAKAAFRAILTRFPASPLAATAAARLNRP